MYARLVRFSTTPGSHSAAQAVADDLAPQIAQQPGCQSVTVFGDEESGEYGVFVLWESRDNAMAAAPMMRPQLDAHLAGHLSSPPDSRLFQVMS